MSKIACIDQPTGWHGLPNELKTHIASYLNSSDMSHLSLVDWQCRDLINSPLLWLGKTIVLKKRISSQDPFWSTMKIRKITQFELEDKACDLTILKAIAALDMPITVIKFEMIDDDMLRCMIQFTSITHLQLSNCSYFDHQVLLDTLIHLNYLTTLALDAYNSLTDKTLYQLCSNCPSLSTLRLRYYHSPVPINRRKFTGIGIRKALATLTRLEEIDFSFSILEDSQYVSDNRAWKSTFYLIFSPMRLKLHLHDKVGEVVENPSIVMKLKRIVLAYARIELTSFLMQHHQNSNLSCLDLSGHSLPDRFAQKLVKAIPTLRELNLSNTDCDNSMLAKLGKLPLIKLNIEKCYKINGYGLYEMALLNGRSIQHLDISFCDIATERLTAVSELFPNLISIYLRGCKQVDDDSFLAIGSGKFLNFIDITGCKKITSSTVQELRLVKRNKILVKH
ncbi:uncharacterized protein TRIADDRAFT_55091 [Trichoplax adhaerens]|uniref:F-box domain-containing protein n=1 Tax=Trichoplax adhaerens TaxID=10228 RepID=B3RQR8_TRIAD|nr:hypothetical protein TRIADDRAFT_55091 [Trichoplax adhaerens]EDV26750.1 hypothetical protein TRIADDRAFT_55091 [Trichoplax adhaerens]|eukprot:XP_002110746.1 hypothetical protein TRIADDRAFT_55091 [Trichoplax adhaerens]